MRQGIATVGFGWLRLIADRLSVGNIWIYLIHLDYLIHLLVAV